MEILRKRVKLAHWMGEVDFSKIEERLYSDPQKERALEAMEESGGEPNLLAYEESTDTYIFADMSAESPLGRRSLCYDGPARTKRKNAPPLSSAMESAEAMGITLLTEEEYLLLQRLGDFDTKTSSWIETPEEIRQKGGALFGDRRYARVFFYHNSAQSYYSSRGFRGKLRV